jgi:tetratricopeptide (TPR) repeat protein
MRAYAQTGRRGAALRQYQACVEILQQELGVEPEAETRALYQDILRSRPRQTSPPAPVLPMRETPGDEPPLVGRDAELATLRRARTEAARGHGRVAIVLGEAGLGKSRLVSELASDGGARVLLGHAYETEHIIPFGPWMNALRTGGVIAEVAEVLDKPWRAELGRLFPELGTPPTRLTDNPEEYLRLFEALRHLVRVVAARAPLVLILEDLHWADDMSLRLLAYLGRRLGGHRLLLVVTVRDEEIRAVPLLQRALAELATTPHVLNVPLGTLSHDDTVMLVQALHRTAPAEGGAGLLAERIWRASEGHPLMIVETVRTLREGAAIESEALPVPARVRDVIAGRLERLTERGRHIASVMAVIGRECDFAVLQHAARLSSEDAAAAVDELVGRRVLHVQAERLDFTHDRVRKGAEARVLEPVRQALHGHAADALHAVYADNLEPHYAALATHYRACGKWAQAIEYLVKFAKAAARTYAYVEAAAALESALALVDRLPADERDARLLDVIPPLARSLFFLNRSQEALELLLRQQARMDALDAPWLTGRYYLLLAMTSFSLGDPDRTVRFAEQSMTRAESANDDGTIGKASYILCGESFWPGRFAAGVAHGVRAVETLQRTGQRGWLALAYWVLGANYTGLGRFAPALDAATQALAIAQAVDDPRARTLANWLSGIVHAMRGEYEAGIAACQSAVASSRDPLNTTLATGFLGFAYVQQGDAARAIPLLDRCVAELGSEGWPQYRGWFLTFLSEAHLLTGDVARARRLAAEGLSLTCAARYSFGIGWAERMLGWSCRAAQAHDEARQHVERALEIFTEIDARYGVGRAHLDLAVLAHERDDGAAAATHVATARAIFEELDLPRYRERALALAATLAIDSRPAGADGEGPLSRPPSGCRRRC